MRIDIPDELVRSTALTPEIMARLASLEARVAALEVADAVPVLPPSLPEPAADHGEAADGPTPLEPFDEVPRALYRPSIAP